MFGITAALLMASACSDDPVARLGDVIDVAQATNVTTNPSARWGDGYAVAAHHLRTGTTAVVTTVGVYLSASAEGEFSEVEVFDGRTDVVGSSVSPDDSLLVVAIGSPTELRWYDLVDGRRLASTSLALGESMQEIQFAAASDALLVSTTNGVRRWNRSALDGRGDLLVDRPVGAFATLADGRVAAPVLGTARLALIGSVTVEDVAMQLPEGATLFDAASSADGTMLAFTYGVGTNDFDRTDAIRVVDASTLDVLGDAQFERPLRSSEWAITTSVIAAAVGNDMVIHTWDGGEVARFTPIDGDPIQAILGVDDRLAIVGRSGAVTTWSPDTATPSIVIEDSLATRFAGIDGTVLTTVDVDGTIRHWDATTATALTDRRFATGEATAAAMNADGSRIAIATSSGQAFVVDRDLGGDTRYEVGGRSTRIDTIEFNPASGQVVTGLAQRLGDLAFDDSVTLWDEATGAPSTTLGGESEDVAGCALFYNRVGFTPDGTLMSTVSHDFSIAVHDGFTGDYVIGLKPFGSTILDTDFSEVGDLLVAAADDGMVTVWDTDDFAELTSYRSLPGGLQALAMIPDDVSMAAIDLTGRLLLLDIMTGEELLTLGELGGRFNTVAVSNDGSVVAAPLSDGSVGLWATVSGARLGALVGHAAPVTDIDFGPGDSSLVTSSHDGTVRTWDIEIEHA